MKKIKELQHRSHLAEGRNYGIGFSILKKIKSKFETYLPFTACRDYLNDFMYVEKYKKEIRTVYGYRHKLLNCFRYKKFFYLGVNSLDFKHGGSWLLKNEAKLILINNYKNLELLINNFENMLSLKTKTTITIDEDTLIFKVPIYWSKSAPLISIYTLLIRCYFNVPDNFILNKENLDLHKPFIEEDKYYIKLVGIFFKEMITTDFININYELFNITTTNSIHNFGIQSCLDKLKL